MHEIQFLWRMERLLEVMEIHGLTVSERAEWQVYGPSLRRLVGNAIASTDWTDCVIEADSLLQEYVELVQMRRSHLRLAA